MPEEDMKARIYPDDLRIIDNVETLKVVADPLRLRVLTVLRRSAATAKEIGRELGVPLKKLYYHLALLEEHGLIRVSETRVVSGIIEKRYQVTAYRLTVDRALLIAGAAPRGADGMGVFLSFVLDHAHAEIQRSIAAGLIDLDAPKTEANGLNIGRVWMRLTPAQREAFDRRLRDLYTEFAGQQAATDDPGASYYEIVVGIYPVVAPPDEPPSSG